jgi:hypothetical protein
MKLKKQLTRGAVKKNDGTFVGGWVPKSLIERLDEAVRTHDTDRSKFIRAALNEKLSREQVAA